MAFYDRAGNLIASGGNADVLFQRVIQNPNLADPSKFTVGLIGANGVINTAQTGCNTSDFIPVTPGKIMSCGFIHKYRHNPWFEAIAEHVPIGIQWPGLILPVVLAWYIITELGSVLENAVTMGAPVPSWLIKLLKASAKIVEVAGDTATGSEENADMIHVNGFAESDTE